MTTYPTMPAELVVLDKPAQDVLFHEARTCSEFTDEPVPEARIRALYDLVKWAPTSMNQQPLRVVLVRSPEARRKLVERLQPGNQDKTAAAPLTAILAADLDFHEHLPTLFPHFPGAKRVFSDPTDRAASARFNAAIQVGYFILGVRAIGLAAGPMSGFDPDALDAEFFPDGRHTALAVVNMGMPGEDPWRERLPRLEYEQVVSTV